MPVLAIASLWSLSRAVRRLAVVLWVGIFLLPLTAAAQPAKTEIMPLHEVKPHMKGYAVTVFSGTTSDRFEVEIIDTVPDFLTGMDVILFRALDPRLKHSGIVAGMSGSPVYINDKMIGAIAYGYTYNKDPVGGITPIEAMLEIDKLPYRPEVQVRTPRWNTKLAAQGASAWLNPKSDPLHQRRQTPAQPTSQDLVPLSQTLGLGGMGHLSRSYLAQTMGLTPVQAGSGGSRRGAAKGKPKKKKWAPGDSVSVLLISGDNSAASNGTVTWVGGKNKDRLLAFGHPMQGSGATELPIADAKVHTIISSVQRSFKLASPLDEQGIMVQDRQPAIAIRTNVRAPMIPVTTEIQGPDPRLKARRYENRVAVHPDFTPNLVTSILLNGVAEAAADRTELIVRTEHEIEYSTRAGGTKTARIEERTFFPQGADGRILAQSRALNALSAILYNPFELGKVHRIVQKVKVEYGSPVEFIESVQLQNGTVRAGERLKLLVKLKSLRDQKVRTLPVQIKIPKRCAGQRIAVHISGGDWARPYQPMANSVEDLVKSLSAAFPERSLVATIFSEQEGLSTPYGMLDRLPPSILGTLGAQAGTQEQVRYKHASRRVLPQPSFIAGLHQFRLDVEQPRTYKR